MNCATMSCLCGCGLTNHHQKEARVIMSQQPRSPMGSLTPDDSPSPSLMWGGGTEDPWRMAGCPLGTGGGSLPTCSSRRSIVASPQAAAWPRGWRRRPARQGGGRGWPAPGSYGRFPFWPQSTLFGRPWSAHNQMVGGYTNKKRSCITTMQCTLQCFSTIEHFCHFCALCAFGSSWPCFAVSGAFGWFWPVLALLPTFGCFRHLWLLFGTFAQLRQVLLHSGHSWQLFAHLRLLLLLFGHPCALLSTFWPLLCLWSCHAIILASWHHLGSPPWGWRRTGRGTG